MPLPSQSQQVCNSFYCVSLCQSLFPQTCVVSYIDYSKNCNKTVDTHWTSLVSATSSTPYNTACFIEHIGRMFGLTKAACHYFHCSATFKIKTTWQ